VGPKGSSAKSLEWAAMLPTGEVRAVRGTASRFGRWLIPSLLGLLTIGVPGGDVAAGKDGPSPWPMAGRDAVHSGAADGPAPPYRRAWTRRIEFGGPAAGPVVAAGAVVVVAARGVVAVDPDRGTVLWEAERAPGPAGPAAVAGDLVVHATGTGTRSALVARRLQDGREVWRAFTGSAVPGGPTVAGGVVYAGTRGGLVVALDAADGEERWRFETQGGVETSPAVAEGMVLAASHDRTGQVTVQAVDAERGGEDPAWRFSPQGVASFPAEAPASDGHSVFVATSDGTIRALGLDGGQEVWTADARDVVSPDQIPAAAGRDLVVADRIHLYLFDPGSGDQRWVFRLADLRLLEDGRANTLSSSSPAVTGDAVLIGDASGLLSAVSLGSGVRVWRGDVGEGPVGAVAVGEGRFFVVSESEEGDLVALEHDPDGRLLHEVSPTVLFPVRALLNFAAAFVVVTAAILTLFRVALRARGRRAGSPDAGSGEERGER
jgi:outer membrane protein assembly factor BamB